MNTRESFLKRFEEIEDVIEYDPSWCEHAMFFAGVVKRKTGPALEVGEVKKCIAPTSTAPRIIMAGTKYGNVVLYEFYSGDNVVMTYHITDDLCEAMANKEVTKGAWSCIMSGQIEKKTSDKLTTSILQILGIEA